MQLRRITKRFLRNKKSPLTKLFAVAAYYNNASFRGVARTLSLLEDCSHAAVRYWWRQLADLFALQRKDRPILAIDETKVKVNGQWVYLWVVLDVKSKEILAFLASEARSYWETTQLLKDALRLCSNKPLVLTDGAPHYKWAVLRLGCRWQHEPRGMRNHIERWFGRLKYRIKNFCVNFRGLTFKRGLENVIIFMNIFVQLYHLRLHGRW